MNAEVKEKWLTALESGEYTQGQNMLHDAINKEFCCLGVLCDIAVKEGIIFPPKFEDGAYLYEGSQGLLPWTVAGWADIPFTDGRMKGDDRALSVMNDSGYTFAEIAEVIRENF